MARAPAVTTVVVAGVAGIAGAALVDGMAAPPVTDTLPTLKPSCFSMALRMAVRSSGPPREATRASCACCSSGPSTRRGQTAETARRLSLPPGWVTWASCACSSSGPSMRRGLTAGTAGRSSMPPGKATRTSCACCSSGQSTRRGPTAKRPGRPRGRRAHAAVEDGFGFGLVLLCKAMVGGNWMDKSLHYLPAAFDGRAATCFVMPDAR